LLFRDVGDFDTPAEPFSDFSTGLKCQLSLGVRSGNRAGVVMSTCEACVENDDESNDDEYGDAGCWHGMAGRRQQAAGAAA
jgi:hypothetical protein